MLFAPHLALAAMLLALLCSASSPGMQQPLMSPTHLQLFDSFPTRSSADIPKVMWVAAREDHYREGLANATLAMYERQRLQGWVINMMFDANITSFMQTEFANTSLLWAYQAINNVTQLGVSRTDIWRVAQLYVKGGLYMDMDGVIVKPFDDVIRTENSTMILTVEKAVGLQRPCYNDSYSLSIAALVSRFGETAYKHSATSRIANWAMFAVPGHPVLYSMLQRVVELIRLEYLRMSVLAAHTDQEHKQRYQQVICLTGPGMLSAVVVEALLVRNFSSTFLHNFISISRRRDFGAYQGLPKLPEYVRKHDPGYYMTALSNVHLRVLHSYAPLPLRRIENVCLTNNRGGYWLVSDGVMRPFTSPQQLAKSGIPRQGCTTIHPDDVAIQSLGEPLPETGFNFSQAWLRSALPHVNMKTVGSTVADELRGVLFV